MKILYLDMHTDNMNPVCRQFPLLLKHLGDIHFFGPGFQSEDVLDEGLLTYYKKHAPFDFAICSENIFLRLIKKWPLEQLTKDFSKQYLCAYDIKKALERGGEIATVFLSLPVPKLITTIMLDNYNAYPELSNFMHNFDGNFLSLGLPFIKPLKELPYIMDETWGNRATDVWFNTVHNLQSKLISIPFFVMEDEFSTLSLSLRPKHISIVGARYSARQEAKNVLKSFGIQYYGSKLPTVVSLWSRLKLQFSLKKNEIVIINHLFRNLIETSRYSFTCGSGYQMPIRKFFEIPALGTVLLCRPCNGFTELGFKSYENSIACDPQDLPSIYNELNKNPKLAEKIALSGQDLIWRKHTAQNRAKQILLCLESIANKSFNGVSWRNGDIILKSK